MQGAHLKAVRVLLGQPIQLPLEQYIVGGDVGEEQGHAGGVLRVAQHLLKDLVDGGDAWGWRRR